MKATYHLNRQWLWMFLWLPLWVSAQPSAIVSLDLCTDWMLIKYADPARVKAFSPLLYQYQAEWVPDGLPVHDGTLEQILDLDSDLIISGEFNAIQLRQRLQQLDKSVSVLPLPTRLQGIRDYHQTFHQLLQSSDIHQLALPEGDVEKRNKRLLLLGANGIGTGQETLEDDVIAAAGWDNYLKQEGYVSMILEQVVSDPPDVVLWASPVSNSLANLFAQHAVMSRLMDESQWLEQEYWRWQCPGPWTFDIIQELAAW